MKSHGGWTLSVTLAAVTLFGCQPGVGGPANPRAVAPVVLVAQGSGPGGSYRVWAFHTSDGWACIEVDSSNAEGGGCDPRGGTPLGGGIARNAQGVIVDGVTTEASAVGAAVRDASGGSTDVPLIDVGPAMPGAKVAIANLDQAANPVAIDFFDVDGVRVDSVALAGVPSDGGGARTSP